MTPHLVSFIFSPHALAKFEFSYSVKQDMYIMTSVINANEFFLLIKKL